jgi:hypothetical protein
MRQACMVACARAHSAYVCLPAGGGVLHGLLMHANVSACNLDTGATSHAQARRSVLVPEASTVR